MTGKHRKVGSKKPVANGTAPPEATNNGTNAASEPNESQVRIKIPNRTKFRNSRNRPMCIPAFKCHLCTSAFVREDSLRSHLRQHQRLQPVTQSVFIVDPAAVSNPTSTQTVDSELVSDSTVTDPSVEETGDISVQQVDTSLTSLQTPCEGLAEQPESENDICVLNVYPQPLLTSDVDPAPDQVIEQALRQSGVLCLPPGTLDCGTTLNLIQNEAGTIELREEPSPTSSFCMTNDDGGNAQAILNAFASLGATSDSGLSTIQASVSPTIDVSDAKTVLMNATNIEIPLSALASGLGSSTQLIYQMQPNIRLVPYRSPATVQYVLKTTPTGCTQILFNSATSETGEPLQMQDLSILQSHVDASPGHQTDTNFGQQLLNYVLNNGAENEPVTPTAVSSVGNTVSRLLLVSTTPVQATGPTALDPLAPPTTPTTTILP